MTTYRHAPTGLSPDVRYRIDTASGSNTAATITTPNDGIAITGSAVLADQLGRVHAFNGTAGTLYAKELDVNGALVSGATPVTLTGTALNALVGAPQRGVTALAGQSGTVTFDLSTADVFVATLTGNVTGWSFSNPPASGIVEVHFVQDSTGSRTLAGANSSIKLAGGAPTLTTTASKRDVFRFRIIAGTFYEISRSLSL